MAQVNFDYKGTKIEIQCNIEDSLEIIIQKFLSKCQNKSAENLIFFYNGEILNKSLIFKEVANDRDKERNVMNVLVNEKQEEGKINMKKSNNIICPQCKEISNISINDYRISLQECKNSHKIKDILFNEFEQTQFIDQSKIICDQCKKMKKSETFENTFYICYSCDKFLCPLCKNFHNKEHNLIIYEQKDFTCYKHYESYISYCKKCKKDICVLCLKEHNGHEMINYGDIIPDIKILEEELNKSKKIINDYKSCINEIILRLNKIEEILDNYYNLYNNIIKNFDIKKRNYNIITNINYMNNYNHDFMSVLSEITKNKNMKNKLNDIMLMYYKMTYKEENNNDELNKEKKEAIDNYRNKSKISFITEDEISKLFILNDGRILTYHKNKMGIYNINNNDVIVCDVSYLRKELSNSYHINIIQMDDDALIELIYNYDRYLLNVIKIKKHSLEQIQSIESSKNKYEKIIKISKEKICIRKNEFFKIFSYQNGNLIDIKKEFQLPIKNYFSIGGCCVINENEIAIVYINDGKIYGLNSFLMFYDLIKFKEIKTLKLGDGYGSKDVCFLNSNFIVANVWKCLIIIDIKNRTVIKEIKDDLYYTNLFQLNNNLICAFDDLTFNIYLFKNVNDYSKYQKNELINDDTKFCKFCLNQEFIVIKNEKKVIIHKNYNNFFNLKNLKTKNIIQ